MKEMVYEKSKKPEVLDSGEYKGHKFAIISLGSHPTAYVENKMGIIDDDDSRLNDVRVHGGFTYCDTGYWDEDSKQTSWLGWDYAHYGDYIYGNTLSGKQWTTVEIYTEVKSVIDQLIAVENDDITRLTAENAELKARLERAIELPMGLRLGAPIYYLQYFCDYKGCDSTTQQFCCGCKEMIERERKNEKYVICQKPFELKDFQEIGKKYFLDSTAAEARLAELKRSKQ